MLLDNKGSWCDIMAFIHLAKREMDKACPEHCQDKPSVPNAKFIAYLTRFHDQEIFQKDLEKAFSLRAATVSRSLKTLESQGYIIRTPSKRDSRMKKITPTEKSMSLDSYIRSSNDRMFRKMTYGISDEELAYFFSILEKMKENLSDQN